jgi:ring-1,2-phenylacetyl-CoA epoxidase subunit PaaA
VLRQRFIDLTIPQARAVGLTLPDPDLTYNEATKHWEIGPIDWSEFYAVISGNGPCNHERLAARRSAHEKGEWVRKAASAYAAKHAPAESRAS